GRDVRVPRDRGGRPGQLLEVRPACQLQRERRPHRAEKQNQRQPRPPPRPAPTHRSPPHSRVLGPRPPLASRGKGAQTPPRPSQPAGCHGEIPARSAGFLADRRTSYARLVPTTISAERSRSRPASAVLFHKVASCVASHCNIWPNPRLHWKQRQQDCFK